MPTLDRSLRLLTLAASLALALPAALSTAAGAGAVTFDLREGRRQRNGATAVMTLTFPEATVEADLIAADPGATVDIRPRSDSAEDTFEIVPGQGVSALRVRAPLDALLLPSRHVESVTFDAKEHSGTTLHLPDENLLVGLAGGGDAMVAIGWPNGKRHVEARLDGNGPSEIVIEFGGQPIVLRVLRANGIWHRFTPKADGHENEFRPAWKPPFGAQWQVQVSEADVPTAYTVRRNDGRIMRPHMPNPRFPAWYRGKEVAMRNAGNLPLLNPTYLIALEGHEKTPYSTLRDALDPERQQAIAELGGADHTSVNWRSGIPWVWHPACGGRDRISGTTLKTGTQNRTAEFIASYSDNRYDVAKIAEIQHGRYEEFMSRLEGRFETWLTEERDDTARAYLGRMRQILAEVHSLYTQRMHNETAVHKLAMAAVYRDRFAALATEGGEEVYPEIRWALNMLNDSLGRQEGLGRRFGTAVRDYFQQAAIEAVDHPGNARYAAAIRQDIRELLSIRRWETPGERPRPLAKAQ